MIFFSFFFELIIKFLHQKQNKLKDVCAINIKQDGRLAPAPPAYFSPEYKCFDQHLQTVKNETTV